MSRKNREEILDQFRKSSNPTDAYLADLAESILKASRNNLVFLLDMMAAAERLPTHDLDRLVELINRATDPEEPTL